MRTVILAAFSFGVGAGFVQVAVPAAAENAGDVAYGGVLLSGWAVGSIIFGLVYARRPWPQHLQTRLPLLLLIFSVLVSLMAAHTTLWGLTVGILVAGSLAAPQLITYSATIDLVAPRGMVAEAFGWIVTACTLGMGAGQSMSGYLVEESGVSTAFFVAGSMGVLIAGVVWLLRGTIRAPASAELATSAVPAH